MRMHAYLWSLLSSESQAVVEIHADYAAALEESDPLLLWAVCKATHEGGVTGMVELDRVRA